MRYPGIGILAAVSALGLTGESPRLQFDALVREFDSAETAAIETIAKASSDQQRGSASVQRPQPQQFAPRFFALAEDHRDDPVALDALIWVASRCVFGDEGEKALRMIARAHSRSDKIKDFCGQCSRYGEPFLPYEELLRTVLNRNPDRQVQGAACLALADYLKMAKETTESYLIKISLESDNSLFARSGLSNDRIANFQTIKDRGLDKVAAESAALFQKVIDQYSDVRLDSNLPANAGEFAKEQLFVLRNLAIGMKAPEIIGKDIHGKPMTLSDYRGKVVVLDFGSHRSCGVCRQYYPHLRRLVQNFKDKPVALLGISVDDDVKELQALTEKGEFSWPILWDGENEQGPLASQWVIRAMPTFFVLDHQGVIRNKGFLQPGDIAATVELLLKQISLPKTLILPVDTPTQAHLPTP